MFSVTETAQSQIADYFKDKEKQPIRIFLSQGCGGSQIGMALDDKKDTDMVYRVSDVEYLVDRELLKQAQPIVIDFLKNGFSISSNLKLSSGCSSCGTSGTCCS